MKISKGDYLILKTGKPILVKCCSDEKGNYKGYVEKQQNSDETELPIKFAHKDVAVNLGRNPKVGKVYGIHVEPLFQTIEDKFWGEIRIYRDFDDKQLKKLRTGLNKAADRFRDLGCTGVPIDTEIRTPVGKYAGYYKYRPKAEKDILCLKLHDDLEDLDYIASHEYGHGVYYRLSSTKRRGRWIKLYHKCIVLDKASQQELDSLLEDIESENSIQDYMSTIEMDEKTALLLRASLRYVQQLHGLTKRHLDQALLAGDSIKPYWPKVMDMSEKKVVISDYAKKSPEEFFAEAFAYYATGKSLPLDVKKMVKKTLGFLIKV